MGLDSYNEMELCEAPGANTVFDANPWSKKAAAITLSTWESGRT